MMQGKTVDDKLYAFVFDKDGCSLVNVKPNILIGRSLKKINSSLAHARDISKEVLGDGCKKLPLVVANSYGQPVVLFPLFSPGSKDNCWVTYNAITNIGGKKDAIRVEFNHQHEWIFNVSRQTFNNQYVNAANLYKAISQRWRS